MEFNFRDGKFQGELAYGTIDVSGDRDKGYTPGELMITSIAVCSVSVLKKVLEKKRLKIRDICVKAHPTFSDKENRFTALKLHFVITGENLDEGKIEKAIELSFKHCPMVQTVKDSIAITETFELKESK